MSEYQDPAQSTAEQHAWADPAPTAGPCDRDWRRWAVPAAVAAAALAVGCAAGIGIGRASDPVTEDEYQTLHGRYQEALDDAETARENSRQVAENVRALEDQLAQQAADLAAREAAVTAVEEQAARNSIENGIWTVGVDIEPGTYRASEPIVGDCYWAIYTSGTNGDDIIENDIPTGGFPTVRLSAGQDFENNGCGTFVKQ